MTRAQAPVMIMAGGTGGHIFPALAIAQQIQQHEIPVIWLGSKGGMEMGLVPKYGIEIVALSVRGLRGKRVTALIMAPFKLALSLMQAIRVILKYRPRAVLGLGGFASGPGGLAAWLLRKPLYIHEQNALPGLTNRWLSKLSNCVMEGFPQSFDRTAVKVPVVYTGNPVRASIVALPGVDARLARKGRLRLFVLGGSLGALKLNQNVPQAIALMPPEQRPEIWHQCGKNHLSVTQAAYEAAGVTARVEAFVDDMAEAYAWADCMVARAGALTIAEIAQAGLAAILVPYPYAVDDHQTANARALVDRGAAILLPDNILQAEELHSRLSQLLKSKENLIQMGNAAHQLSQPEAASKVADICLNGCPVQEVAA